MSHSHYSLAALLLALGCGGAEPPPTAPVASSTPCPVTPPALAPSAAPVAATPPAAAALTQGVSVGLKNPLAVARTAETISVRLSDALKVLPALKVANLIVQDATGGAVLSQLVDSDGDGKPDELVFQADFQPSENKTFLIGEGTRATPTRDQYKVYGRFVRERHDDFAWENDRIAHRVYGPALETWKADPLTSSGIDVWVKRTPRLVVNDWYQSDDYHRDNGDGADFYSVGPSRGCGGVGVWDGKALHVSRNFTDTRVIANGPVRLIFELSYAPWDVGGGAKVSETKRVIADAGQHFDRFESSFKISGKAHGQALAIGIAKHAGGVFETDQPRGIMRSWEPYPEGNGHLGCAVIAVSAPASGFAENTSDRLLLTALPENAPAAYLAGTGWDKSGHVADSAAWTAMVNSAAENAHSPIAITLSAKTAAP
jgi:hypothetical protein